MDAHTSGRPQADRSDATGPTAPEVAVGDGSGGRVKVAQDQARRSIVLGVGFAVAALVGAVLPHDTGAWLPLHLFLVGTVLLAISGATQLFTITWGACSPAPRVAIVTQRWMLAAGAAGLAVGRELGAPTSLLAAAGAAVAGALLLLGALLLIEHRSARVDRFGPAVHSYLAAIVAGLGGAVLGAAMLTGRAGVRDAHVILNLLGLVGLVVAGTVPYFAATQARMKMSPRATAHAMHRSLLWLAGGVTVAAIGALGSHTGVLALGLACYALGVAHVAWTLPRPGRKQVRWAGPRLTQLALGLVWWAGAVALAAARAAVGLAPLPEPLLLALVIGGYAQILVASLAYLGPVLRGGGHVALSDGFAATRSRASVVLVNLAGVAALTEHAGVALILLSLLTVDALVRGARLLPGARPPTPSSPSPRNECSHV